MRLLLAVCAIVAVAHAAVPNRVTRSTSRGHRSGDECTCVFRGWGGGHHGMTGEFMSTMVSGMVEGQNARLDKLAARLEEIEKKAHDKIDKAHGLVKDLKALEYRVHNMEGSSCAIDEFECGRPSYECVHEMHMCDGVKDCYNGADESEENCVNYMPAGAVFEGYIHNEDHCTQRKPYKLRAVVTGVTTKTWFKSVPKVTVSVLVYYHDKNEDRVDTLPGHGEWDYAHHRLLVHALEADGLGLWCKFDGVQDDRCHAHLFNENTGKDCLEFWMHKVDH